MENKKQEIKCSSHICLLAESFSDTELKITEKECSLDKEYKQYHKNIIVNNFKKINLILLSIGSIALIIILSKIYGFETFDWNKLSLPLSDSWVIFLILSLAHLYFGLNLIKAIKKVDKINCDSVRRDIYMSVSSSDNVLISGLNPKPILTSAILKSFFIKVDKKDLSYWLRVIVHIIMFLSIIDFDINSFSDFIKSKYLYIGFYITLFNSWFGSRYLISFYGLAYSKFNWGMNLIDPKNKE